MQANLSCDKTVETFGVGGIMYTLTNYVTLQYRTDSWGTDSHGFSLVVTAFKNTETRGCQDGFECGNGICIDHDLVCDNVNHCGDSEDERHSQFCSRKYSRPSKAYC